MPTSAEKFAQLFPYGTLVSFNQSEMQLTIDKDKNAEGICFELSRMWVMDVLRNGQNFDGELFKDECYSLSTKNLMHLIGLHNTRGTVATENFMVPNTTRTNITKRRVEGSAPAMFRAVVLRDREAVIDQMYQTPGVYLYGVKGHGGGHAFGFEFVTGNNARIRFFDPNLGSYHIPGCNIADVNNFKQFWSFVWGEVQFPSGTYKKMARRTIFADKFRVLSRFTLN